MWQNQEYEKRTSWLAVTTVLAVALATGPQVAQAGPVQATGNVVKAVMECVGLGHAQDDLIWRDGGPIPDLIDFGKRNDGFGVKVMPDKYREVAYFQYDHVEGDDWYYYLTGYTSDPEINCVSTLTSKVCRDAHDKLDEWADYTINVVGQGDLTKLQLPPEIDPDQDCPLPQ